MSVDRSERNEIRLGLRILEEFDNAEGLGQLGYVSESDNTGKVEIRKILQVVEEGSNIQSSERQCEKEIECRKTYAEKLKEIVLENNLSKSLVEKLLKIAYEEGIDVPLSCEVFLGTQREKIVTVPLSNGQYLHLGLKNGLRNYDFLFDDNQKEVILDFGTDGMPLGESSYFTSATISPAVTPPATITTTVTPSVGITTAIYQKIDMILENITNNQEINNINTKRIIKKLNENMKHIDRVQRPLKTMLDCDIIEPTKCFYNTPCQNEAELEKLNSELIDSEKQTHYVSFLRMITINGEEMPNFIQKIITDKCLFSFNYAGVQNKLPLKIYTNWLKCLKTAWGYTDQELKYNLTKASKLNKSRINRHNCNMRQRQAVS